MSTDDSEKRGPAAPEPMRDRTLSCVMCTFVDWMPSLLTMCIRGCAIHPRLTCPYGLGREVSRLLCSPTAVGAVLGKGLQARRLFIRLGKTKHVVSSSVPCRLLRRRHFRTRLSVTSSFQDPDSFHLIDAQHTRTLSGVCIHRARLTHDVVSNLKSHRGALGPSPRPLTPTFLLSRSDSESGIFCFFLATLYGSSKWVAPSTTDQGSGECTMLTDAFRPYFLRGSVLSLSPLRMGKSGEIPPRRLSQNQARHPLNAAR